MLTIETVAVLGASEAGTACAVLAALAGGHVRLHDASHEALEGAFEAIRSRVEWALAAGALTRTEKQRILDGVLVTPDLDEAVTSSDFVIDAGGAEPAALEARRARLPALTRASTGLALAAERTGVAAPVAAAGALAARLAQPGRVLALRLDDLAGPLPRLEVVAGAATLPHVVARASAFAARVNCAARTGAHPAERSP